MKMLTPDDIKKLRRDRQMTAKAFAERLGVTIDTVFKWESGVRHPKWSAQLKLNALLEEQTQESEVA
jgi:DNA-binding transcriptional regulator YiaG